MPYTYNAQDVFDFANANGFQYRQKGNEITFKLCPYCNGGNTPDKETFSINRDTGAYKCLRNSCSRQGHFVQLARDFGYKLDMGEQKVYRSLPQTKPEDRVSPPYQAKMTRLLGTDCRDLFNTQGGFETPLPIWLLSGKRFRPTPTPHSQKIPKTKISFSHNFLNRGQALV